MKTSTLSRHVLAFALSIAGVSACVDPIEVHAAAAPGARFERYRSFSLVGASRESALRG